MTTPKEKIVEIGTPLQKISSVMDASTNYFFVGVTDAGEIAYSVLLDSPSWQEVSLLCTYTDYIKQALVGQYEWLPMEECDD